LAVKITRQTKNIVLLGSPTSAAALRAGNERAPAALRAAGIADRLKAAGFQVGDQATRQPTFSNLTTNTLAPEMFPRF